MDARPVYLIPDGDGGWLRTSPATQDRLFRLELERSGNKLRKISQLLKWWKHARELPLPIRSFYIDMLLCSGGGGSAVGKTYGSCLKDFFNSHGGRGSCAAFERRRLDCSFSRRLGLWLRPALDDGGETVQGGLQVGNLRTCG